MPQPRHQTKPQPDDKGYPATFSWWSRDEMVDMNYAFGCALVDAIHNGLERYPLRPKVDETPWVPTYYPRAPIYSGMTSSATLCAEAGLDCAVGNPMGRRG